MNAEPVVKPTPALDAPPVLDELVISDVDTLRVLTDRQRLRIMESFARHGGEPRTVKDVASELGEAQTKLYYHVNLLEQHGLLVVAGSRLVSGIVEKSYRPAARQFRVNRELFGAVSAGGTTAAEVGDAIANVFDAATDDLRAVIASGELVPGDGKNLVSYGTMRLNSEQVSRVRELLTEILATTDSSDENATDYALAIGFYPLPSADAKR